MQVLLFQYSISCFYAVLYIEALSSSDLFSISTYIYLYPASTHLFGLFLVHLFYLNLFHLFFSWLITFISSLVQFILYFYTYIMFPCYEFSSLLLLQALSLPYGNNKSS